MPSLSASPGRTAAEATLVSGAAYATLTLAAGVAFAAPAAGVVLHPAGAPAIAIVETGAGQVVAVDLVTRSMRFSLPTGDGNRICPVLSGGLAILATTFGQLYAVVVS